MINEFDPPLTCVELDVVGCDEPDCQNDHGEIFISSSCHPQSAVAAKYVKADGTMVLQCAQCGAYVCAIMVARDDSGLGRRDSQTFVKALLDPPEPNDALKAAANRYRTRKLDS